MIESLLIAGLRVLCLVALLPSSCSMAADVDLKKAILGKWMLGPESIEFFEDGTVAIKTPQGNMDGTYDVIGHDESSVEMDVVTVYFNGLGIWALPFKGKLSPSGTEFVLTSGNGQEHFRFTRAK